MQLTRFFETLVEPPAGPGKNEPASVKPAPTSDVPTPQVFPSVSITAIPDVALPPQEAPPEVEEITQRTKRPGLLAVIAALIVVLISIAIAFTVSQWKERQRLQAIIDAPPTMSLEFAIREKDIEQIKSNFNHGADANEPDARGFTPMKIACMRGNAAVLALLLQHGAKVTEADAWGRTTLHWAVGGNNLEATQFLIEHGADVNAADKTGVTPLAEANRYGHKAVAKVLSERGATTMPAAPRQ